MAEGDEEFLESPTMREFRRVLRDGKVASGMNTTQYGKKLKYLSQPIFNNIINGRAMPGIRAFIDIVENHLDCIVYIRKKGEPAPPSDE